MDLGCSSLTGWLLAAVVLIHPHPSPFLCRPFRRLLWPWQNLLELLNLQKMAQCRISQWPELVKGRWPEKVTKKEYEGEEVRSKEEARFWEQRRLLGSGSSSACLEASRTAEVTDGRAPAPEFPNLVPATLRGVLATVSRRPELDSKWARNQAYLEQDMMR